MGEWREEKGEQQSGWLVGWLVGGATALAARLLLLLALPSFRLILGDNTGSALVFGWKAEKKEEEIEKSDRLKSWIRRFGTLPQGH